MKYLLPFGKRYHIVIEVKLEGIKAKDWKEYINDRLNYARANFKELEKFCGSIKWDKLLKDKEVQIKYEILLDKYNEGVFQFVPMHKVKMIRHSWYNARCAKAKKDKDKAWKKVKKQWNEGNREEYKQARNEYLNIKKKKKGTLKRIK